MEVYFDNSATTRCSDGAKELMVRALSQDYGNPSSLHGKGLEGENYIREARDKIAKTLKVNGSELIFTSGQLGLMPETGTLPEGVEAQTHQSLKNLAVVLEAAGSDLEHVVKTNVFLDDINDFAKVNEIYAQYFQGETPARSCVQAAKLPNIEIRKPKSILAQETISSMQAGLVYGCIGQTEYIVRKIKEETGISNMKTVATGGLGKIIAEATECIDVYDPNLTLNGLRLIYNRYKRT